MCLTAAGGSRSGLLEVNTMAVMEHPCPRRLAFTATLLLLLVLCVVPTIDTRMSAISDLKSRISGVEELLEEFRKQLQQDQTYRPTEVADSCVSDFSSARESIIRAKASIEQGATFLMAPDRVYTWRDCVHACCGQPHCTVAVVQEEPRQAGESLNCYLFNCTYRKQNVCSFAPQPGFASHSRPTNVTLGRGPSDSPGGGAETQEVDEPPRCDAGQDVMIQLPTDWAVLDGRDSVDDHGISRYDWTLVKGDTAITMKATHPGLLKISGLQEGVYTFQMTVSDTSGQKTSDNVSVTVLAPKHQAEVCTGHCSNYQFKCDDGCCIDIMFACDGKQHCPDRSDEDFCPNFDTRRKSVTHAEGLSIPQFPATDTDESMNSFVHQAPPRKTEDNSRPSLQRSKATPTTNGQQDSNSQDPCTAAPVVGPCKGTFPRWYYDHSAGECKSFLYGGCQGNHNNFLQESDCVSECIQTSPGFKPATVAPPITKQSETAASGVSQNQESEIADSKQFIVKGGHPIPESGAILPLALGLIITTLLLLMIACRLRLVRRQLKKARPLTTEESDYLINGMYL
ncbi:low-density lipoprotein receptor-related protein 11 [Stigmatopora argus]